MSTSAVCGTGSVTEGAPVSPPPSPLSGEPRMTPGGGAAAATGAGRPLPDRKR